ILLSRGKKFLKPLRSLVTAFTGLPPVVAGLCVYFLITRNGPLGRFKLLYSPPAMIIAQVIIVLPVITAAVYPAFLRASEDMRETCAGLRLSKYKTFFLLLRECRFAGVSAVMTGYGRAISEVGAVKLVGGNIAGKTRVMTTAVLTETGRGNYATAMLLGGLLLGVSLCINLLAGKLRGER
ncbi:MAG: ABC transporter permease, partial [Clostridia bacterium]|nr:ABC transporter permease [Clostridia bacterium]